MRLSRAIAPALLGVLAAACVPETPLPTATATLHWATVDLPRASYCWNSGTRAECADSAGPDQLLATGYLKPYRTAGGFDAAIEFHGPSTSKSFTVELVLSPGGASPRTIPTAGNQSFTVAPVMVSGVYVYLVTGTWANGDVGFYLPLELIPGTA